MTLKNGINTNFYKTFVLRENFVSLTIKTERKTIMFLKYTSYQCTDMLFTLH